MACKTKYGRAHSGAVEGSGFYGLWRRDAGSPVPGVCMGGGALCMGGGALSSRNCLTLKMALPSIAHQHGVTSDKPESSHHPCMDRMDASTARSGNPPWQQAGKQAPGKPHAVNWRQFLSLLHFRYRRPSTRISGAATHSANCQFTKVWTHATYPSLRQSVPMTLAVPVPWMCIPFLSSLHWNVPVRWIWSNAVNCRTAHCRQAGRNCVDRTVRAIVLNSPHIWHTCTVTSLKMGYSVRLSECLSHGLTVLYTCKRYFINNSTTFPAPLFTKLINIQKRYTESSSAEFHTNRLWNMESTSRNKSNVRLLLRRFSWNSCTLNKVLYTTSRPSVTKNLQAVQQLILRHGRTDGRTWPPHREFWRLR